MKDFHGVLYLQKLDIRAAASNLQNDENEVMNEAHEVRSEKKANEGAPFSPFHLWCPE